MEKPTHGHPGCRSSSLGCLPIVPLVREQTLFKCAACIWNYFSKVPAAADAMVLLRMELTSLPVVQFCQAPPLLAYRTDREYFFFFLGCLLSILAASP